MNKTIMIVDDSSSIRSVVGIALSKEGYNVIQACDGSDALTKLDGTKIHLIVCDVNMPNMDGITFLKQLKQNASYCYTPVCMLTTESEQSKIEEGKQAGARAWVIKPFQPPKLLSVVQKLIG